MRKPRVIEIERTKAEPDWLPIASESENLPAILATPPLKIWRLSRIFLVGLAGLILLGLGNWAQSLLLSLAAWGAVWFYAGLGFLGLMLLALLGIIWREAMALYRLQQLETWQSLAKSGLELHAREATARLIKDLAATYRARPELAQASARLASHASDIMDPPDHIRLAEREWMLPLDQKAKARIAAAVKSVGFITAIAPSASLDMMFVAYQNFKLMRDLSHLYGGRPGLFASIKLIRMALTHVAIAGGLALSDQLLQQFLGKGLAGKLSARLGEGAVNGILTARIGLAALDILRPLPWLAEKKPQLLGFISSLPKAREAE